MTDIQETFIIAELIRTQAELRETMAALTATVSGLQALEKIRLLKANELAELFQVSGNRIYELVRTRSLPSISLGDHQMRFDPIAVRRWLDEGDCEVVQDGAGESKPVSARGLQVAARGV